ncbi:integrin alpha-3 isoform X1 [Phyllobates terribilis]|uniref:integrin alpha-3 isoform X1 n=1 Tax=Phyllobates terribilis TaxID=111132 RepID=UPI003CCAA960
MSAGPAPVCLLLGLCLACAGFNVDTQFPVIKQAGVPGGMFGFSVLLHKQSEGQQRYLMLSGAPQDAAPPNVNVNRTGAVYACPISMSKSDCFRVSIDQEYLPGSNVIENMWLGVTLASQGPGGRVLMCAHRYSVVLPSEDQPKMIGKCYIRGNDLEFNDNDDWQAYHYEMCDSGGDHLKTGMCQMGMSGGITENMVYFGAPSAYNWQGTDYVVQRDNWDLMDSSYPNTDTFNIYLGYSVQLGMNVLLKNKITIVSGAPRWNHKGAVYLMEMEEKNLQLKQVLRGDQVGSYFGNIIALADFNNDGWQDIAVGAPYYFDQRKEIGGAVYIYMNEVGSFIDTPSLVLHGPTDSGFGFAVANIGDINQDGFTDLAVGAPFDEMGKLYIYLSKSTGLQTKPSQIIDGAQVGGIQMFGYSVNGAMDVDGNSYPDLLVGSLSDRIAMLRSRPVISISKTFSATPLLVDASKCSSSSPCIDINLCFSYMLSTGNASYKENIILQYTVEADFDRRPIRMKFLGAAGGVYKGFFSMPDTKCQTLQLLLLENIRDKLHPIHVSLKYNILEREQKNPRRIINLDRFPILNEDQSTEDMLEIHFQKECGVDNVCRSNLQMQYEYLGENSEPLPRVDGSQILYYDLNVKRLHLRIVVTNAPTPTSSADDAHEAILNVTFPSELIFSAVRPIGSCVFEGTVLCQLGNPFRRNQRAEIDITFEALGIDLKTREVITGLQLSTLSKQDGLEEEYAEFLVDYTLETSLSVTPQNLQTYFSGKVMGESAMKTAHDVGSPVSFIFMVKNEGEPLNSLVSLILAVEWPHEVANGKWLLYLTEVTVKTKSVTQCQPAGDIINPLNLTLSESRRRRREAVKFELPDVQVLPAVKRPNTVLRCGGGGANCVRFECPLNDMEAFAEITVLARVWNSTFLEDYRYADRVWVEGAAELYLKTDIDSIKMRSQHVSFSVTIDSELVEPPPAELPLWVIIVSVVSGILLLGVIIIILWKVGFFHRVRQYSLGQTHYAVCVRQEERQELCGRLPNSQRHWVTTWKETARYY